MSDARNRRDAAEANVRDAMQQLFQAITEKARVEEETEVALMVEEAERLAAAELSERARRADNRAAGFEAALAELRRRAEVLRRACPSERKLVKDERKLRELHAQEEGLVLAYEDALLRSLPQSRLAALETRITATRAELASLAQAQVEVEDAARELQAVLAEIDDASTGRQAALSEAAVARKSIETLPELRGGLARDAAAKVKAAREERAHAPLPSKLIGPDPFHESADGLVHLGNGWVLNPKTGATAQVS
jgi:hypothetical protein